MMDADRMKKLAAQRLGVGHEKVADRGRFVEDRRADTSDVREVVIALGEELGIGTPERIAETIEPVAEALECPIESQPCSLSVAEESEDGSASSADLEELTPLTLVSGRTAASRVMPKALPIHLREKTSNIPLICPMCHTQLEVDEDHCPVCRTHDVGPADA
jgi:acyl carrier protein